MVYMATAEHHIRKRCKGTNHAFDGDVSVRRWEDVRERFEDPQSPETQDMGSYRDSEKD